MIKKLTKHGNSWALIIDKPVLDLLNINPETPLEITTDGKLLLISPVKDDKRKSSFKRALEETNRKFGSALKRLANWPMSPDFLTLEQIHEIHDDEIARYGGASGTWEFGLLESALA